MASHRATEEQWRSATWAPHNDSKAAVLLELSSRITTLENLMAVVSEEIQGLRVRMETQEWRPSMFERGEQASEPQSEAGPAPSPAAETKEPGETMTELDPADRMWLRHYPTISVTRAYREGYYFAMTGNGNPVARLSRSS